ncbi:MAG: DUF4465 domain-containing protein [Prolixibacteraceae bacterium]|jgi:hypothetical protein|nr:DUF4465 domain-containing protein [Prolixibacteraceae bacterium]
MKHFYLFFLLFAATFSVRAQKAAAFEDVVLLKESYWNGSDGSGGFKSSNLTFKNDYNPAWMSWSGFACSNITDNKTKGWGNQYSAIAGKGHNGSANYAVAYVVGVSSAEFAVAQSIRGVYVTNSSYAYFSMKEGDDYSKKFGGATGSDPDFLKLIAEGVDASGKTTASAEFYLADFRSNDPSEDYLVGDWKWFDLSALGIVKTVNFKLESSDNGMWGMNTPAYFCLDDMNGFGPIQLNDITHARFDDVFDQKETYYNGDDLSGGFYSGNFYFKNEYNESWGSWSGFAVSTKTDTQTPGWGNQYSAITGGGVAGSSAYAVGYTGMGKSEVLLKKSSVSGFYVSNCAYAYWSMKNGDDYSKKFGGPDGTDPDWFKLTIKGYTDIEYMGHIDFYLADFRSDKSSEDYIVDDWQWVDLSALGKVSRLEFSLSSSDEGMWGMNTPAYFVMDNLNKQIPTTVYPQIKEIYAEVYPNPFIDELRVHLNDPANEVFLYDMTGKPVRRTAGAGDTVVLRNLGGLPSGVYFLKVLSGNQSVVKKIIKK